MQKAPHGEGQVGAVPQADEQEGHQRVQIAAKGALPAATEGDIDVIPHPRGERHVPAPPELTDRR